MTPVAAAAVDLPANPASQGQRSTA